LCRYLTDYATLPFSATFKALISPRTTSQTTRNMKATIGVYENQAKALAAIQVLKAAGYPEKQISILTHSKADHHPEDAGESEEGEGVDSDNVYAEPMRIAATGVGIGAVAGPVLGALAGVGLLAIPGLGVLVGAGALAGAIAGLDVGIIGGGIISALAIARVNKHHEDLYQEHLSEGRYLVVAQGTETEIEHARDVLHSHDDHLQLDTHV
jgi:hypothetical protein